MAEKQPWKQPGLKVFRVFTNGAQHGPLRTRLDAFARLKEMIRAGDLRTIEVRGQELGGGWKTLIRYQNGRKVL